MREIKFRAIYRQSDAAGKIYGSKLIYFTIEDLVKINPEDLIGLESEKDYEIYYHDKSTLMQYTGLKDSKDVEIYEGDIRWGKYHSLDGGWITSYQVMKWDNNDACFCWNGSFIPDFIDVVIIGNIYENVGLVYDS